MTSRTPMPPSPARRAPARRRSRSPKKTIELDPLRLRRRPQQVPRLAVGPPAVPEGLEVQGRRADRVPADRRRRAPLLHRQRRRLHRPRREDRQGGLEEAARLAERLLARLLQGRPLQRQPLPRPGARRSRPRRQGAVAQAARRSRRVVAAGPVRADVLRQRGRATCSRSTSTTARPSGRPASAARSRPRRRSTTATSTSATTAAT